MKYTIIVGNIGQVHQTNNKVEAVRIFTAYVASSKTNLGRSGGEDVTLMADDEPIKEHFGMLHNV